MKKNKRQKAALAAILIMAVLGLTGCERIRETYGRRSPDGPGGQD